MPSYSLVSSAMILMRYLWKRLNFTHKLKIQDVSSRLVMKWKRSVSKDITCYVFAIGKKVQDGAFLQINKEGYL